MEKKTKRTRVEKAVQEVAGRAWAVAKAVYSFAEPPFKEVRSAEAIADFLAANGFEVEFPFRRIPTAFRAAWGRGRPRIGFLGEYDALPGCGLEEGAWGHGCGHHLLGAGAALGAVASAKLMREVGLSGTIVYYGCPAEETLAGKVYMARDGAFRDLDVCLAWHPSASTGANNAGGSALDSLLYEFFGRTAHGASAHRGRSALDAAILFDVAVNYLREHIPENVRIHMVIRCGGEAPNVVPAYARSWYYLRGKDRKQVDEVRKRLDACARAGALATSTTMKVTRITGVYNRLPNDSLARLVRENLVLFGPPRPTPADRKRAREVGVGQEFDCRVEEGFGAQGRASSDEDNVSWLVPLGKFSMTCMTKDTPGHNRLLTAQGLFPFARRGMVQAGKVFVGCALDLLTRPALVRKVRAEFRRRTRGFTYDPLVPKRQTVPVDLP